MALGDIMNAMRGGTPLSPADRPRTGLLQGLTVTPPILDPRYITKLVAKSDATSQYSRSGGTDRYMHLSSLIGACPREHAISQQYARDTPVSTTTWGSMKMVWAIGRAVEKHIRDSVIKARNFVGIYGVWTCACGESYYEGEYLGPNRCRICRKSVNRYKEPALRNDFGMVVGSPDITMIEMGHIVAVEIKSMNKEQFDALEDPLADHILQACGYRWLYEYLGFKVHDKVIIMYGRKDFKFGGTHSVYKEYHVDYRPWAAQIEQMMTIGRQVANSYETGILPPRTCENVTCTRAKSCTRTVLCFGL